MATMAKKLNLFQVRSKVFVFQWYFTILSYFIVRDVCDALLLFLSFNIHVFVEIAYGLLAFRLRSYFFYRVSIGFRYVFVLMKNAPVEGRSINFINVRFLIRYATCVVWNLKLWFFCMFWFLVLAHFENMTLEFRKGISTALILNLKKNQVSSQH